MKILKAVVRNYLETGEPVGSRTISKYTDLNLSSATIRNEMADLEELGYILQPHTSAGRIPSDKGYRLYVDHMMAEKEKEVQEIKEMLLKKEEKMDQLLKQTARLLANDTNYAALVSAPVVQGNKVKFVQLSRVDETHLVAVVVAEGNLIRNNMISVSASVDDETLLKLNILLNTSLNGLTLREINLGMIANLKAQAGAHEEIVSEVLDAVARTIGEDEDLEIYTSGAKNIFRYPELSDNEKASEIISTFEEKNMLHSLVKKTLEEDQQSGIQVYIGDESPVESMKDCSVVTATYDLGDGMKGTIGIVGPKRMDYEKVVDTMKNIMGQLDQMYK
ncbi:MAG: heat-inducible transcriptional repressor HrcA [Lachnospiraceae bacterium]|nr:heat-inducible transcriptional repressor HrcA [Lachnospiraceae bacterium]